jgi:uncharacterized membrane protein
MDWPLFVVQWLHVLLGMFWFGNALVLDVIVIPAINQLPIVKQREVASLIGARATPIFIVVPILIVALGVVRGTLLGPIQDIDTLFGTAYGITWLVALIVTVAVYLWGLLAIIPALRAMDAVPVAADGGPTPELEAATNRVKAFVSLELIGFFVIFTCMILMRFGAAL